MKKKNYLLPLLFAGFLVSCSDTTEKRADTTNVIIEEPELTPEQTEQLETSTTNLEILMDSSAAQIENEQAELDNLLNDI